MKILILTQWFQPEPMFKGLPFAKALQEHGHDVEVLTGFPNYPEGKLYSGYRVKPWQREDMDGVSVIRTALYPSHDHSGIRRMLNYISFSISSAVLGPFLVKKPDVIYVYNLVTLMPTAKILRVAHKAKIVLDVQDLWPESVISSGMMKNRALGRLLGGWCRKQYQCADFLTVLSAGFKRRLVEQGLNESRVGVIYNWCSEFKQKFSEEATKILKREMVKSNDFNILFAGTIGELQGLNVVLEAAHKLEKMKKNIVFTLMGGGVDVARLKQKAKGLKNVNFLPRCAPEKAADMMASADALLVHLKEDPLFHITVPSKTQASLFAGRPILMGVAGDASELVSRANAGICFKSDSGESLAGAALQLYRMSPGERERMGQNGKAFYLTKLSFQEGVSKFDNLFRKLIKD